jgi:hypothetical protein
MTHIIQSIHDVLTITYFTHLWAEFVPQAISLIALTHNNKIYWNPITDSSPVILLEYFFDP